MDNSLEGIDLNECITHSKKQDSQLHSDIMSHLQNLTRIGVALSSTTNLEDIFDLILEEAIAFSNADAATIYQVSHDGSYLEFVVVYNKTLNLHMGGPINPIIWPHIPLYDKNGKPHLNHVVANAFHRGELICIDDVYRIKKYDVSGTKSMDEANNYRSKSMLTIPLKNHDDEVLGVLQVINAMSSKGEIVPFSNDHKIMLQSLASQAAMAMSNHKLINDMETLLLQFMQSIAKGIERKSVYSSNHITRVALLTDMIAQKVNDDKTGKYKQVSFSTNELQELSMAGLMHDVGKIITPEHIINKSTKLEAITDRINMVNLRFELFKKALTLYKLEVGEENLLPKAKVWYPEKRLLDFNDILVCLNEDKQFLKSVNIGTEFLPDSSLDRIKRIQEITFKWEGETWNLLTEDEVSHLQIRRGTLSTVERKTIDEHVIVTWEMLSRLSFPRKFKNVPLYAASHHEKLNGKGHPFGLRADQIPLQSRIIAIADIFEALTSADRPYKKGIKLSESLQILAQCALNKEIDSDVLDLIIDSGLCYNFAKEFMNPQQIDEVDVSSIKKIYHQESSDQ